MTKQIIKIEFYDKFKCLASDCPITCCKEWKIAVDEATCKKWSTTEWKGNKKADITEFLSEYLTEKEGSTVISLNEIRECPFLNQQKLCNLVLDYGEDMLSKTCQEFPRQMHEFENRREYSLTSCCPAVIDLLNEGEELLYSENMENIDNTKMRWLFQMRSLLIRCMQNKSNTIEKALLMGFYLLLEAKRDMLHTREDVEELSEALEHMEGSLVDTFAECNGLFLDITENYRKQGIYRNFLEELTQIAEQLELYENYYQKEFIQDIKEFEEAFLPYENLFRNYLVSEFYGQLLLPEYEWEDMVIAMQWIGIEYAVIRHGLFLSWKINKKLDYERVREIIVYVARMTGYDDTDIREYLEECFESLIWEWGYFAFMIGYRRRIL